MPPPQREPAAAPARQLPVHGGVCALGRGYGGWAPNGQAARICHLAYGS